MKEVPVTFTQTVRQSDCEFYTDGKREEMAVTFTDNKRGMEVTFTQTVRGR